MKTHILNCFAAVVLSAGTAFASSPAVGSSNPAWGDSRVLTAEQLSSVAGYSAYEAIRNLRPGWLHKRGTHSLQFEGDIVIYLDRVRLGGPESLRSLSVNSIARMEFLDPGTATERWGSGHSHGAILILSRS